MKEVVEALAQILEDMGDGLCACNYSKARGRIAIEPYIDDDARECIMPLDDARKICEELL